jgi:hypothetical protein
VPREEGSRRAQILLFMRKISAECGPRCTPADLTHQHFTQSIRSA